MHCNAVAAGLLTPLLMRGIHSSHISMHRLQKAKTSVMHSRHNDSDQL